MASHAVRFRPLLSTARPTPPRAAARRGHAPAFLVVRCSSAGAPSAAQALKVRLAPEIRLLVLFLASVAFRAFRGALGCGITRVTERQLSPSPAISCDDSMVLPACGTVGTLDSLFRRRRICDGVAGQKLVCLIAAMLLAVSRSWIISTHVGFRDVIMGSTLLTPFSDSELDPSGYEIRNNEVALFCTVAVGESETISQDDCNLFCRSLLSQPSLLRARRLELADCGKRCTPCFRIMPIFITLYFFRNCCL